MEDLLFEVKNRIATITLNRPQSKNAFSLSMLQAWIKALEQVRDDSNIRVLILTGAGNTFCAGGDIKAMKAGKGFIQMEEEQELDITSTGLKRKNLLTHIVHRIQLLMEEIDKPTIAAINGDAVGAGIDMTFQYDLRFASENARIAEGYVKVGLIPGDGGGYFLPRLIGMDHALDLLWSGRLLSAEEAKAYGIVTRVIPEEQLMEEVYQLANRLVDGPQQSIRLIKRIVQQGLKSDLKTSLDTAAAYMGLVTEHPDFQEALSAMFEKRQPKFE